VLELIQDGVNGLVVRPEPEDLAAAIDRLGRDRALAERLGNASTDTIARLGIGWDTVVESLAG
jgi:glycosyltransferase involved in cell wall biosynthesis